MTRVPASPPSPSDPTELLLALLKACERRFTPESSREDLPDDLWEAVANAQGWANAGRRP